MKAMIPGDPSLFGDFARRLHEDADGKVVADYRQSFETLQLQATKRLHEPLTGDELATRNAMAEGAQLGMEVISAVWDSLHP